MYTFIQWKKSTRQMKAEGNIALHPYMTLHAQTHMRLNKTAQCTHNLVQSPSLLNCAGLCASIEYSRRDTV